MPRLFPGPVSLAGTLDPHPNPTVCKAQCWGPGWGPCDGTGTQQELSKWCWMGMCYWVLPKTMTIGSLGLECISCGSCPLATMPGQAGWSWQNLEDPQRKASHREEMTKSSCMETRSWVAPSSLLCTCLPCPGSHPWPELPVLETGSCPGITIFLSWSGGRQPPPLSQHKLVPLVWWKARLSGNSCC